MLHYYSSDLSLEKVFLSFLQMNFEIRCIYFCKKYFDYLL